MSYETFVPAIHSARGRGFSLDAIIDRPVYYTKEDHEKYLKRAKPSVLSQQLAKAEHEHMMKTSENYRNHHINIMLAQQKAKMAHEQSSKKALETLKEVGFKTNG